MSRGRAHGAVAALGEVESAVGAEDGLLGAMVLEAAGEVDDRVLDRLKIRAAHDGDFAGPVGHVLEREVAVGNPDDRVGGGGGGVERETGDEARRRQLVEAEVMICGVPSVPSALMVQRKMRPSSVLA